MKIAKPPIFSQLHVNAIVHKAAEIKPPGLIVCYDPSLQMLVIASVIVDGIIHWTIVGPTARADVEVIAEPFRIKQGHDPDSVHFFDFDSSKIVHLSAGNDPQH